MFKLRKDVEDITLSAYEVNGQSLYTVHVSGHGGEMILNETLFFSKNREKCLLSKQKERKMREKGLHSFLIERRGYSYKGMFYYPKTEVQDNFHLYPEEIGYLLVDFFED